MSLYVSCTLFQESELPMKADTKLYVFLLCPKKNWKQYCTVCSWHLCNLTVNSWGLFLHAVIFSLNTDSFHIWKIKGIFSTILFHYFFFSITFPQYCDLPKSETWLFTWCIILSYLHVPTSWVKYQSQILTRPFPKASSLMPSLAYVHKLTKLHEVCFICTRQHIGTYFHLENPPPKKVMWKRSQRLKH